MTAVVAWASGKPRQLPAAATVEGQHAQGSPWVLPSRGVRRKPTAKASPTEHLALDE